MRIILLALGFGLSLMSCSKEERSLSLVAKKKSGDPVIAYYGQFGSVERMDESYEGHANLVCSNFQGIYQFIPKSGPFAESLCEIYRFTHQSDISGPCDDTFTLEQKEAQVGKVTYIHCPEDGNNCKTLDMPWGCTLVFCDENEVKS